MAPKPVNSDQRDLLTRHSARPTRTGRAQQEGEAGHTHTPEKAQRSKKQLGKASKAILNKIDTKLQSDRSCMTGDE